MRALSEATTLRRPGRATAPRTHSGVSRGTLGELFQGPHWIGGAPEICIASLPSDQCSWCYFIEGGRDGTACAALASPRRRKTARAIAGFLEFYGRTLPPGHWEFHSELETGTGMASSTADIVAALRCLYSVFDLPVDQRVIRGILHRIERADSVFIDEFALYLSARHEVVRPLGGEVGFHACYAVEDGEVCTESVGAELLAHYRRAREPYARCVDALVAAFHSGDAAAVARCSTRSAELGQEVLPKRSFDGLRSGLADLGADGIFTAHTGTVIGYLFSRRPGSELMGGLSSHFRGLGLQCRFARVGWGRV